MAISKQVNTPKERFSEQDVTKLRKMQHEIKRKKYQRFTEGENRENKGETVQRHSNLRTQEIQ